MSRLLLLTAVSAFALSGCGTGDGDDNAAANASLPSRTENGQLTVRAQGMDLKINLPPPIRRMAEDDDFLYPGSRPERGGGERTRFHSDDPPAAVARWYRDPARASRFAIAGETREGAALLLTGTARNGDSLTVRLAPGADGGTDGTVLVAGR